VHKLKNGKAPDRWELTAEHLKLADPIVYDLIAEIFNKIFRQRHIPSELKNGVVTPVYKGKGPKHIPDSYRRITVTSLIAKLLERCLLEETRSRLESKLNKL
jgi:hypothetical protein